MLFKWDYTFLLVKEMYYFENMCETIARHTKFINFQKAGPNLHAKCELLIGKSTIDERTNRRPHKLTFTFRRAYRQSFRRLTQQHLPSLKKWRFEILMVITLYIFSFYEKIRNKKKQMIKLNRNLINKYNCSWWPLFAMNQFRFSLHND